jgi:hypothetical protein
MPSDQKPITPEETELAEYRVWERVERKLWSRGWFFLALSVVLVLLVALLGLPLIEARIEQRIEQRAELLIAERATAMEVDVDALRAAVRDEVRSETEYQKEQLLKAQFALERRVTSLLEQTREFEESTSAYESSAGEYETFRAQLQRLQQAQKNEEERLHNLRTSYERELTAFRQDVSSLEQEIRRQASREMGYVEYTVERDLDELRLILADQMAGKPAIFSSYVDLDQRAAQLVGANFGEDRGNVFIRLRAYTMGGEEPVEESESILLQGGEWSDSRIDLRIPAAAVEKIREAQLAARSSQKTPPRFRYGFLIQTAAGRMSQWTGKRVDSVVPPTRTRPETDDADDAE